MPPATGEPITARRASLIYVTKKKLLRHKAIVAVTLTAAALLIGATIWYVLDLQAKKEFAEQTRRWRATCCGPINIEDHDPCLQRVRRSSMLTLPVVGSDQGRAWGGGSVDMSAAGFHFEPLPERGILVCRIVGEVPREEISQVEAAGLRLVGRGYSRVVLDLSETDSVSSTALGMMFYYHKFLHDNGGCFVLVKPKPAVTRMLSACDLEATFRVYDTFDEALAAADPGAPGSELIS